MVDAVAAATIALQRRPILRAEVVAGRPASGSVGDDSVAAVALRPVERLVGTPENGFRAVGQALYRAKRDGRNRVAGSEEHPSELQSRRHLVCQRLPEK